MDYMIKIALIIVCTVVPVCMSAQNGQGMEIGHTGVAVTGQTTAGGTVSALSGRVSYGLKQSPVLSVAATARWQRTGVWPDDCTSAGLPLSPGDAGISGTHDVVSVGADAGVRTLMFGKPLVGFGMLRGDISPYGMERVSIMAAGILMLRADRNTQFGVGPMLLLGTSSWWPLFPMFIWRHRVSDRLTVSLYGCIGGADWQLTRRDRLTAGFDIDSRSFYFRPHTGDMPSVCRYVHTVFRPMVKYRRQLSPAFSAEVESGIEMNMSNRVYGRTGTHCYMEMTPRPVPFVQAVLSWRP